MEIILVMQSILAINAIWHNIFDTAFDNAKFKSSIKIFLFSIDNFMKILLEINFSRAKIGWGNENSLWNCFNLSSHLQFQKNSRNTTTRCKIYSKLTTQQSKWRQWLCLLLTLNRFASSSCFIVNFVQVNNNNNDGNSHDEDADRTDFKMNLILFFKLGGELWRVRAEVYFDYHYTKNKVFHWPYSGWESQKGTLPYQFLLSNIYKRRN